MRRVFQASQVLLALGLSGCGAGVAGVAATSGGSSGGSTPTITSFRVLGPKESPAILHLEASESVLADLSFVRNGVESAMTALTDPGVSGSRVSLAAGVNELTWDFAAELGGTAFVPDVDLVARRTNGALISGGTLRIGMGNDAPAIAGVFAPSEEVVGTADVRFTVADSSADLVDVRVEVNTDAPLFPEESWTLAHPAGLPPGTPTPPFAFTGVRARTAADGGTSLVFFWDVVGDLGRTERDARLRFTPTDLDESAIPVDVGIPIASPTFHVDNNAAPIVQLDSGPLITNPDERRGIPIPFRVIDEEGDLVEVIFQWRREGEEFPSLDTDGDGTVENPELDAILADPDLRQEHHVCTPYPHFAHGVVVPIDEDTVRLPELARSESWILASGIVGRTLELLRPSSIPAPITPTWHSNPLVSPIAALPVGDGLTALVLDVPGQGRLREIELATGAVVREIATFGSGIPSAMAFERREKAVLVALDDAGTWRIDRVELASGAITELIVSDGTEPAPVRGIASLGTNALVFTVGSSLFHLDYRNPLARQLGRLLTDLVTPWSVIVDPSPSDRIYVSERDADRVLAIELDSHGKLPVVVKTADMQLGTLEAPEALALERYGSRMLIVTSAPGGGRQLLGLDLGATGGNRSFPIGASTATDVSSVASGSDELRLLCLPASNEVLAAGGIEQRRVIAAHTTSSQEASVERLFDPVPIPGQPWRLPEEAQRLLSASAEGIERPFVWDSTDAPGSVFVQATARDDEVGVAADGAAPKRVRGGLEVDPIALGGPGTTDAPDSIAAADLDGDGDQDLVSANGDGNNLTVFFQLSPGTFAAAPLTLGGPGTTNVPNSIAAADLDGDGDQDLVSANVSGNNLTVFFQLSPGSFAAAPLVLGGTATTFGPFSVAAADLDGDGDQDLVSANISGDNLTIFFQLSPGSFQASPLTLGSSATTDGPLSVVAADLDGDGDLELVSANRNSDNLTVFFQLSAGSFGAAPFALGDSATTDEPRSVAAADLDGDGDQDLVSANFVGNSLTVFFQESPAGFSAIPLVVGGPGTTDQPIFVTAADLDGDKDSEIISANFANSPFGRSNLTVFFQHSRGSFDGIPVVIGNFGTRIFPFSVAAADLDGDGDMDLTFANRGGDDLTVFFHRSSGSLGAPPLELGSLTTNRPVSVAVADLDGDGDLDLLSGNRQDLTVIRQLSPGSFEGAPVVLLGSPTTISASSVAVADLDGDGDQDIVPASANGENLAVFFQHTPGSFGATPLVLGGSGITDGPRSVAVADLDGDGDQDLVSANSEGLFTHNLTVFFQLAPGSFAAAPLVLSRAFSDGPSSVAAPDLDGDGDTDLVSANVLSSNLTIWFQVAPGVFGAVSNVGGLAATTGPRSVAAADLDEDGDLDLVSANEDGNNLTVFFQLSPGSFGRTPLVLGDPATTDFPVSIAAADLDGDGDQDLVSANQNSRNLTVFSQLLPGSFQAAPLVLRDSSTTNRPGSIAAADLDGDGDQDLVSANSFGNAGNLTVFFGGR